MELRKRAALADRDCGLGLEMTSRVIALYFVSESSPDVFMCPALENWAEPQLESRAGGLTGPKYKPLIKTVLLWAFSVRTPWMEISCFKKRNIHFSWVKICMQGQWFNSFTFSTLLFFVLFHSSLFFFSYASYSSSSFSLRFFSFLLTFFSLFCCFSLLHLLHLLLHLHIFFPLLPFSSAHPWVYWFSINSFLLPLPSSSPLFFYSFLLILILSLHLFFLFTFYISIITFMATTSSSGAGRVLLWTVFAWVKICSLSSQLLPRVVAHSHFGTFVSLCIDLNACCWSVGRNQSTEENQNRH